MTKTHGKVDKGAFIRELVKGRFSRRQFNKTLSAAGLAMATLPLIPRGASAQDEAIVFTWGGYELPEFHQTYIDKHGMSPNFVLFGDEDEAFAKVAAGFRPDLSHPCSPLTKKWRDAGLTQAIDTSRLSNWPDIFPALQDLEGTQFDGEQWFMPFDWGRTSITYRTDLVDIEEESLGLLWDERYAGRLAVIDAAGDTLAIAAIYAGIDPFNMSSEELDTVVDLLRKQRPLLRMYTNDLTSVAQALASGELVAALTWDDTAAGLKAEGIPVKFMEPKEGVLTWVCGLVLLKDAPNLDRAYDVIDAFIDPSAGQYLISEYGYGHSNAKSFELVSDERLAELGIPKDPTELLYSGVFFQLFKDYEKTITMFEEVKAGF